MLGKVMTASSGGEYTYGGGIKSSRYNRNSHSSGGCKDLGP